MMTAEELRRRISSINVWKRGDERALHKPLLLLYALARARRGAHRLIPYREIDEILDRLLREFGPPRKSYYPEFPFWHLQTDGRSAKTS